MGNHPSAIADDGQSSIHRQTYTVRGDLNARAVTASTINARVVFARRITCMKAQIANKEELPPSRYPQPPHRSVTAHTLNVDTIYADEINCKTLRAYDVIVGEGEQWRARHLQWMDRNQVGWDGKEDESSDSSDNDSEGERSANPDRQRRKKMMTYGAVGAVGVAAIGGAALAYTHHQKHEKEEERRKEEEELRRRQEEMQQNQFQQQQQQHQQQPMQQHHGGPAPVHHGGGGSRGGSGNFHMSSRGARLWSDGNHCFLIAECDAGGSEFRESRLDLDVHVTNDNGHFRWTHGGEPGNFSGTAQRWEIVDGSVMVADLQHVDGSWSRERINLDEHITNENGNLRFVG